MESQTTNLKRRSRFFMITRSKQDTKKSEQNIFNNTYDTDFDVIAIEILGYDSDANVLRRIPVTSTGALKVVVT